MAAYATLSTVLPNEAGRYAGGGKAEHNSPRVFAFRQV